MIENQNIRQILAIMVTDIVDYTETMNNDEQKAWEYLKKQRTLIPPMISKMNGQMFKEMGDGTFSKFKSAIDAVQCAVKIQEEANNNELPIRIAVHLGDVMDDGVDVIGTGVNVASRINNLANKGNIVISEDVWRQIRNQGDLEATSMGQKDIKGYHQTVEVFELTYNPDGSITKKVKVTETVTVTDEEGKQVQAESAKKEFIKKVAIFPFEYEGDEKNDYLKYGFPFGSCISLLQDPLVELEFPNSTELQGDFFISKLRKSGYERGGGIPLPLKKKIAKELHCEYFIVGSIKLLDNDFHITSKVYSTNNGKLINESIIQGTNYFNLIDEFSIQIRRDLGIPKSHIDEIENLPISEITTGSLDVFKNYIKGILTLEIENNYEKSFNLFQKAIKNDPTFSLGNYALFWCCFASNNTDYQREGNKAINSAIGHIYKLPPRLSFLIKIHNYMYHRGEPDKAEKVIRMWIKQFPDSLIPLKKLAGIIKQQRKIDEAIMIYNEILEKNPENYSSFWELSECYSLLGDYKNALNYAEKYMEKCPSEAASYKLIGDIYSEKGEEETAKDYYEQGLMLESNSSNFMVNIANAELALGNFSEAEEQLEDALTFCKTNQDFYDVHLTKQKYYCKRGKIKEAIISHEKAIEYMSKYTNPIDTILSNIMHINFYVFINQTDIGLTKLKKVINKLTHPWNLLAGFGEILLGSFSENKELVYSGIKNMEEFLKIKDFGWLKQFPVIGHGFLKMIEKNYSEAIQGFESVLEKEPQYKVFLSQWILKGKNNIKKYDIAISMGLKFLKEDPNNPEIMLELVKSYSGKNEIDHAKEYLTKLLNIWEDADEEYIYFQEAKILWKELNTVREPA